jgi:hypothetical protein
MYTFFGLQAYMYSVCTFCKSLLYNYSYLQDLVPFGHQVQWMRSFKTLYVVIILIWLGHRIIRAAYMYYGIGGNRYNSLNTCPYMCYYAIMMRAQKFLKIYHQRQKWVKLRLILTMKVAAGYSPSSLCNATGLGLSRKKGISLRVLFWAGRNAATRTIVRSINWPRPLNDIANAHAFLDIAIFSLAHLAIRRTSLLSAGLLTVEILVGFGKLFRRIMGVL